MSEQGMGVEIELPWCEAGGKKEKLALHYARAVFSYYAGSDWMRPGPGVHGLTEQENAKVRQAAYKALREFFPGRFPKGHRFN